LFDLERQRTDIGRLILYLLRHPASIGSLLGFSRQISHARAVLTEAIVALAREL
jgi:hypothetical protein